MKNRCPFDSRSESLPRSSRQAPARSPSEEIRERIEAINSRNPIRDPDSMERAVKFACEHPGFPGCDDESLRRSCRPENCFYARLKNARTGNTQVTHE